MSSNYDVSLALNDIKMAKISLESVDNCREKSIALTKLDEAEMWLKKIN